MDRGKPERASAYTVAHAVQGGLRIIRGRRAAGKATASRAHDPPRARAPGLPRGTHVPDAPPSRMGYSVLLAEERELECAGSGFRRPVAYRRVARTRLMGPLHHLSA